jgi:hypothetical protein
MLILDGFYQNDFYKSWLKSWGVWRSATAFGGQKLNKQGRWGACSGQLEELVPELNLLLAFFICSLSWQFQPADRFSAAGQGRRATQLPAAKALCAQREGSCTRTRLPAAVRSNRLPQGHVVTVVSLLIYDPTRHQATHTQIPTNDSEATWLSTWLSTHTQIPYRQPTWLSDVYPRLAEKIKVRCKQTGRA